VITVYSFLAIILLLHRRLSRSPMTCIFLLGCLIKVIYPFYYFSKNSDISVIGDMMAASSIVIVVFFSLSNIRKAHGDRIVIAKRYIHSAMILLPIMWLIFFVPMIFRFEMPPLWMALCGDPIAAHDARVFITKSTMGGYLIEFIGKVIFPMLLLVLSISLNSQNKSERIISYFLLSLTAIVSFSYFQKAFPFTLIIIFVIGLSISGYMSKKKWLLFGVIFAILLLLVSVSASSGFDIGILKFQDLLFRRMGKTPVIVYEAYIEFGQEYEPAFLEHSFILNKTPNNQALPMVIYEYLSYGTSDTGWANGFYVGDLFVNFGIAGVLVSSIIIGKIINIGNKTISKSKYNLSFIVGIMGMAMFCLSIPGNAFFAFSTFFYIGIFVMCYYLNMHPVVWRTKRLYDLETESAI
jgi:hypothetical protein